MIFHWPQIALIGLQCISLGMVTMKHGKPQRANHNIVTSLIAVAIVNTLLYFGGFFN
jgi:hypothetical protein